MKRDRHAAAVLTALLGVAFAAATGCSTAGSSAAGSSTAGSSAAGLTAAGLTARTAARERASVAGPAVAAGALPPVTGAGVRALWQGAPGADLTFDGGMLLGVISGVGRPPAVHAVSAATGKPLWSAAMPASVPFVQALVPAGRVVVVEASRPIGVAGTGVYRDIVLRRATGKTLWTAAVGGTYPSPPVASSGKYLLTADTSDAVTARIAATGAVVWRDARPAGCGPAFNAVTPGVGLAADGSLVAASFYCGRRVVVRRLDPATGKTLWTWRSPGVADAGLLTLAAAAGDAGLLLLTGMIGPPPDAERLARALPHPRSWPPALGSNDEESTVLALGANGRPRWTEVGGEQQTFHLTAAAVCEVITAGLECRGDATGAATLPTLVTGAGGNHVPAVIGDDPAGVSDGLVAVTIASAKPGVVLCVDRVHGGSTVAQARIALGAAAAGKWTFAVAAAPLNARTIVVLLRLVLAPGDASHPVLALAVQVPPGA